MIILTGGAGFIGSAFLWKLNSEGFSDILVVDQFDTPLKQRNLSNKKFIDLIDKDEFIKKVENREFTADSGSSVFHIGACSSTTEDDMDFLLKNNVEYSKTLAKFALENKFPFYYASSAAVYGDGSLGYSDDDKRIKDMRPLNKYGYSKQLFDLWLYANNLADKVAGFRYFNVFGPNEYHKGDMRSLVVKAYEQIKRDGKIRLFKSYKKEYKDGEQKRDFIYIKDVVDIMYGFFLNKEYKGIYNVGTGIARTWNDLAKAIFLALKIDPNIEYIDMPDYIKDKYQYFTQAELKKFKTSNLKVQTSPLEDAVADYVNNYLENNLACL